MKIPKFKVQMKVILMITTTIISVFLIRLLLMGGLAKLLSFDSQRTEVYKDTDITHYQWYIGKNAKKEYADKWGMDESIFPESITDNMDVLDYKMVYYNPWDAQYLSYLVVKYDDKSYEEEIQRLGQYDSKEYKGYFGARGFRDKYRLLAIEVDPDHGLIYALGEENNQIIYVELIFCNYFYDIDYQIGYRTPEAALDKISFSFGHWFWFVNFFFSVCHNKRPPMILIFYHRRPNLQRFFHRL